MNQADKQVLRAFMKERFFCTIATVDAGAKPEAAFVGYTSNDEFEILIGTSNKSRKYRNILQNTSVALVIADTSGEIQYEGEIEEISHEMYNAFVEEGRFPKPPGFDKYRKDPTQVYLKATPAWIRFILHGETDEIKEFTEFTV